MMDSLKELREVQEEQDRLKDDLKQLQRENP